MIVPTATAAQWTLPLSDTQTGPIFVRLHTTDVRAVKVFSGGWRGEPNNLHHPDSELPVAAPGDPAAFSMPTGAVPGDLGRNMLRGFSASEVDLTSRRQFKL